MPAAAGEVAGAVAAALTELGAGPADTASAVVAAASAELGLPGALADRLPELRLHVVGDVVAAWASVARAGPAVGAVAGTGSNVFGVGPAGAAWRAGGWGHLLSDEGSAWWLAVRGVAAALAERDGTGPATALGAAVRRHFGVARVEDVQDAVYAQPFAKDAVAAFAREVAAVARDGDEVALGLLRRAGADLGGLIGAVVARTGLDREADVRVGTVGGAWQSGPALVDACAAVVARAAPGARLVAPELEPWGGALVLAGRAAGVEPDAVAAGVLRARA